MMMVNENAKKIVAVAPIIPAQSKMRILKEYSLSLSTTDLTQSTEIIQPIGDVVALDLELDVVGTGSPTGAASILNSIKALVLTDRDGKPILDLKGTDLDKITLYRGRAGKYVSPPVITGSGSTDSWDARINLPIVLSDQPSKVQVTFGPFSDLATSGITAATVALKVRFWYSALPAGTRTQRIYKRTFDAGAGDNSFGTQLIDNRDVIMMGFTVGTESNINHLTFGVDATKDDYLKMPLRQLISTEEELFLSGHTTGILNMFVAPFKMRIQQTKFDFNMAGSDTIILYVVALN